MGNQRPLQRIMTGINLPGESIPGETLIEVFGDSRLLIERHHGVICYDSNIIRVKTRCDEICIHGCNLVIAQMTNIHLVILGKIHAVILGKEGVVTK